MLDLLNALTALVALEPEQAELLAAIIDGPQITVADLEAAEILPVPADATKPPPVAKKAKTRPHHAGLIPAQTEGTRLMKIFPRNLRTGVVFSVRLC